MNWKETLILAIVFLSLGGYVYFFEREIEETIPDVENLIDFNTEDVREIVLKSRNQTILFEKENDKWKIKQPQSVDLDQRKVEDLLTVFHYRIVRVLEISPSEVSQFGLDPPELEFGLKLKGEETFKTLLIGSDSPGGGSCYGMITGKSKVYVLGIRYKIELNRDLNYFL